MSCYSCVLWPDRLRSPPSDTLHHVTFRRWFASVDGARRIVSTSSLHLVHVGGGGVQSQMLLGLLINVMWLEIYRFYAPFYDFEVR